MNIAIIGPAHPLRGGLAAYDQRLATELNRQGHKAVIYSFSLQYPSFLFPGTTQYSDEPAPPGLTIHTAINSINPLNWVKVGNSIKKKKYDLVIVRYWLPFMGPCLGTILRIVKGNKHTRVLCIADNVIPHEKRPGDEPFTKYFLKPVDRFVTMSKEVLQDLRTFTDKPAVFNPHPLYDNYGDAIPKDVALKQLGLYAGDKHILFFGFIRKYKGLDILLDAMNDERIKSANIKLIVAGEYYDDRAGYEEQIKKHDLQDSVKLFTDFIPDSEVKNYFSAADIVVQPYKNATQSGITLVAYHFEKPMIVTNVGGLPEIVPDGKAGFVTAPDATEIASAILKFYEPNSIPTLEENLLTEKRKYSWDHFTKQLLAAAFN
jgi:glycosyltransferase involved in cell wall biosynthesis